MTFQDLMELITTRIPEGARPALLVRFVERAATVPIATVTYDEPTNQLLFVAVPHPPLLRTEDPPDPLPLCIECTWSGITSNQCVCTNMTVKRWHDPVFAQYAVPCEEERLPTGSFPCGFAAKLFAPRGATQQTRLPDLTTKES